MDKPTSPRASHSASSSARTCSNRPQVCGQCAPGAAHPRPPASSTRPQHPPKSHSEIAPLCAEFAIRPRRTGGWERSPPSERAAYQSALHPHSAQPGGVRRAPAAGVSPWFIGVPSVAVPSFRDRKYAGAQQRACKAKRAMKPRALPVAGNHPARISGKHAAIETGLPLGKELATQKVQHEANGAASFAGRRAMIFDRLIPTYVNPRAHPAASASEWHPSQSHKSHCAYAFGSSKGSGRPKVPVPAPCCGLLEGAPSIRAAARWLAIAASEEKSTITRNGFTMTRNGQCARATAARWPTVRLHTRVAQRLATRISVRLLRGF